MRIIPKRTKVRLEFFKGIGIVDLIVGMVGVTIAALLFLSDLPGHIAISLLMVVFFIAIIVPIDDEKGYMMIYNAVLYLVRFKSFERTTEQPVKKSTQKESLFDTLFKKGETPDVFDITPFTGITDEYIEYNGEYYGVVVEIPPVEFRFFTEMRQDNVIDRVYGGVLRSVMGSDSAEMIKIDRPIIYDSYVKSEEKKLKEIKEAYLNGLLSDDELTKRVAIIQDRIEKIKNLNTKDLVYDSFHYIVFYGKEKKGILGIARDMVETMRQADMDCHILSEKELVIFLKYNYGLYFDEREAYSLEREQYLDWILPKKIEFTTRQVKYDGVITHNFRIKDYPTLVTNAWGAGLFNTPHTRAVLKMKPVERYKSIRQIDHALEEVRSQYSDTGKVSKTMELETHFQSLTKVLSMLQGDNETLFDVNVYVTVYDYELTKKEEDYKKGIKVNEENFSLPLKKKVKRRMSEDNFKSTDLFMQQFEAYASASVSAYDAFRVESRGIHSSSVAACFPYVYKTLNDANGICLGESAGIPVFINFFKRDKDRVNSNV
ncbi:MAG: hypothetical protein MJ119_06205, partial [Lachnospiraceae bacterium]|nr:hypothetical protein [Lachnospiraceae bacterium]